FYIAMFAQQLMQQLLQRVAFPAYAKAQDAPRSELLRRVRKVRLTLMATMLPLLSILVLFGQPIIDFLYDPRYHSGGWMVQVLAAGGMVGVVLANGPIFLALGKSHLQTIMLAFQSVGLLGGMFLGGWL